MFNSFYRRGCTTAHETVKISLPDGGYAAAHPTANHVEIQSQFFQMLTHTPPSSSPKLRSNLNIFISSLNQFINYHILHFFIFSFFITKSINKYKKLAYKCQHHLLTQYINLYIFLSHTHSLTYLFPMLTNTNSNSIFIFILFLFLSQQTNQITIHAGTTATTTATPATTAVHAQPQTQNKSNHRRQPANIHGDREDTITTHKRNNNKKKTKRKQNNMPGTRSNEN